MAARTTKLDTLESQAWVIEIPGNPGYCGVGAYGIAFANGKAETDNPAAAAWFEAHQKTYTVTAK